MIDAEDAEEIKRVLRGIRRQLKEYDIYGVVKNPQLLRNRLQQIKNQCPMDLFVESFDDYAQTMSTVFFGMGIERTESLKEEPLDMVLLRLLDDPALRPIY